MNSEKYDSILKTIKNYVNEHIYDPDKTVNEMYNELKIYIDQIGEMYISYYIKEYAYNVFVERIEYENKLFKLKNVL